MQTIKAGDTVTVRGFRKAYSFNTARGYSLPGETPDSAHDRAVKLGHDTAWTINAGTVLCGDKGHYERENAKEAEMMARAITVADGEQVEIEGEIFVVKVNGERFSDPVSFKRAGA